MLSDTYCRNICKAVSCCFYSKCSTAIDGPKGNLANMWLTVAENSKLPDSWPPT